MFCFCSTSKREREKSQECWGEWGLESSNVERRVSGRMTSSSATRVTYMARAQCCALLFSYGRSKAYAPTESGGVDSGTRRAREHKTESNREGEKEQEARKESTRGRERESGTHSNRRTELE